MIGRGAYGRPWFINQAAEYLKNQKPKADPSFEEQYQTVLEHYEDMLSHYGTIVGVRMAKKHLGWYSTGKQNSADFRNNVMKESNPEIVKQLVKEFFDKQIELRESGFNFADLEQTEIIDSNTELAA
jgi:tRNA-dihydrouridine synthase B